MKQQRHKQMHGRERERKVTRAGLWLELEIAGQGHRSCEKRSLAQRHSRAPKPKSARFLSQKWLCWWSEVHCWPIWTSALSNQEALNQYSLALGRREFCSVEVVQQRSFRNFVIANMTYTTHAGTSIFIRWNAVIKRWHTRKKPMLELFWIKIQIPCNLSFCVWQVEM